MGWGGRVLKWGRGGVVDGVGVGACQAATVGRSQAAHGLQFVCTQRSSSPPCVLPCLLPPRPLASFHRLLQPAGRPELAFPLLHVCTALHVAVCRHSCVCQHQHSMCIMPPPLCCCSRGPSRAGFPTAGEGAGGGSRELQHTCKQARTSCTPCTCLLLLWLDCSAALCLVN